jgi:hypothetical protein
LQLSVDPQNKRQSQMRPAFLKYLIYYFGVLGFNLLSSPLILSLPDLLSGKWELYENSRLSMPERLPPLSDKV